MHWSNIPAASLAVLRQGAVIPAHLLALDASRKLDQRRQRALTRYYLDAGVGGVAVGGIHLSASFWQRFAEIDNVVAIKMAPFSRYRTLDVVRAVVAARAEQRV